MVDLHPLVAFWPQPTGRRSSTWRALHALGRACASVGLLLALSGSQPGWAALIATGDGQGNTTAPAEPGEDPGFGHVGKLNGLSGVYFRNGWVLTAAHVGEGPIELLGTPYDPVPGSAVRFVNEDGSPADLLAFKLERLPPLLDLAIASSPPAIGSLISLAGNGRDRGEATSWMGMNGWLWGGTRSIRWGTNRISILNSWPLNTQAFGITFDDIPATSANPHEADLANGDSGGAAFLSNGSGHELVGILFARASFEGQPANSSLFGNVGYIADLHAYRDQILAIANQPECSDGLDNDRDGFSDYGVDVGCASSTDPSEKTENFGCDNGLDDDGDGLIDFPDDPGCVVPWDLTERSPIIQCDNGLDDDGDLAIDYPADSGCLHPSNLIEAPEPDALAPLAAGLVTLHVLHTRRRRTRP